MSEDETLIDEAAHSIVAAAIEIVGECPAELFTLIMARAAQTAAARGVTEALDGGHLDEWLALSTPTKSHLRVIAGPDKSGDE
jgi:hypothetical protein